MINVQRMFFTTTTTGGDGDVLLWICLFMSRRHISSARPGQSSQFPAEGEGDSKKEKAERLSEAIALCVHCSEMRYLAIAQEHFFFFFIFSLHYCTALSPPEKKLLEDHVGQTFDCVLLFSPPPPPQLDWPLHRGKMLSFHLSLPHF